MLIELSSRGEQSPQNSRECEESELDSAWLRGTTRQKPMGSPKPGHGARAENWWVGGPILPEEGWGKGKICEQ